MYRSYLGTVTSILALSFFLLCPLRVLAEVALYLLYAESHPGTSLQVPATRTWIPNVGPARL